MGCSSYCLNRCAIPPLLHLLDGLYLLGSNRWAIPPWLHLLSLACIYVCMLAHERKEGGERQGRGGVRRITFCQARSRFILSCSESSIMA
jgi:hypothetical protein